MGKEYKNFRHTPRWQKLRARVRREEKGLCRACDENGFTSDGKIVDHIIPVWKGGDKWDRDNLQLLCIDCEKDKTHQERIEREKLKLENDGWLKVIQKLTSTN